MSEQLDEMNIIELCEMMKFFRIPTSGLTNLDDMRTKLRKYLEGSSTRKIGETHQVISDAGKLDTQKRMKLQHLYMKTADFVDCLDTEFVERLQKSWGDLKTILKESIEQVAPREQYVVLVAGETGAGKSSVINLILGEDLLYHGLLSTTSTIWELKYGIKPTIRAHYQEKGTQSRDPATYELVDSAEETYQQQINRFVYLREDRDKRPYKKIELFLPHTLLREKVMIVDSPGVGESDVMSEFVLNYLSRAFCFVYVINSDNAGGVQEDRLGMLLNSAQSNLTTAAKSQLALFTGCTLFVCNKWDRIKSEEEEEVKKEQITKLSKKLVKLDPKSQIVYLSCTTAQKAQSYGYITEDFNQLITGISNLLVSSMQSNLQIYFRHLEDLLFHVSLQIKVTLKTTLMSRDETEKKIGRVMSRMEELRISQQRNFDELSQYQSETLTQIIQKLVAYFNSVDTAKKFCTWSLSEAPEAKATWQETKSEVLNCISERTHQFVQYWEDTEHEFARAQDLLIKYCSEKFQVMEEEIRELEEDVIFCNFELETPKHEVVTPAKPRQKPRRNVSEPTPLWLRQGLASVIVANIALPLDSLCAKVKKTFRHKSKLETYVNEPCDYMSRLSWKCLKVIATQRRLLPFVETQLVDAVQFLRQIKDKIAKLLEGEEQLYKQLLEDKRSKTQIQEIYQPLDEEVESLTRELIVYNVREMRKSDFTDDELEWDENFKSIIGSGSFSTVYKGDLTRQGDQEIKVALKVYRDPLTTSNVWHFIDKERALRKFEHPHIVKFYGTSLLKTPESVRVILVMEKCEGNLKSHIFEHPEAVPGKSEDTAVIKEAFRWVQQITDALTFMHNQGVVHGHLKLESIKLSQENLVKITDVGISKPVMDITGSLAGTPVYIAPEAFHSKVYDCKADIYSLGILMWEIWYGQQAFNNFPVKSLQDFFAIVHGGTRPEHVDGCKQPPPCWKRMMTSCWNRSPEERPTAKECYDNIPTLCLKDGGPLKILPEQKAEARVDEESKQARISSTERKKRYENNLPQIRRTLDDKIQLRNTKEQELKENEKIVQQLLGTLDEEQQMKTRAVKELRQARNAYAELKERLESDLVFMQRTVDVLQRTVEEEQKARIAVNEELNQARGACIEVEETLETERLSNQYRQIDLQNVIVEQRGHLEEVCQRKTTLEEQRTTLQEQKTILEEQKTALEEQKTTLEERLNRLELQMEEEMTRHLSTERELQSAVTVAEQALAEYQRHQSCDWIIQREEIVLSEEILGRGAWGNVREGCFRGCKVAVKEIHELILSDHNRKLFEREMNIASRCRHPNLLQFIGATNDDESPLFVTELLDSSLRRLLSQRALKRDETVGLALDIAKGLSYLHLNKPCPIMHRDISSANVLLWRRDESWRAKLSDYGAANFMRQYMTANPGAIIYSAPEAFTTQQTPKLDIYSFGVLLCEMCIRELPDPQELHKQIGRVDGVMRGLIQRCVHSDPTQRPTMSEIINELEQLV